MQEISRFYGMTVSICGKDHAAPHMHVQYQDMQMVMDLETGLMEGRFPPHGIALVQKWLEKYRSEIIKNWEIVLNDSTVKQVKPLL